MDCFISLLREFSWKEQKQTVVHVKPSCGVKFVEHVQVRLNMTFWPRGDLLVDLKSPFGTVSRLTQYRVMDRFRGYSVGLTDWTITSLHHWGEESLGKWQLTIRSVKREGKV